MKRHNITILLAAIICVTIIIGVTAYAEKSVDEMSQTAEIQAAAIDPSLMIGEAKYQYTAKFICGEVKPSTGQNVYNMPSQGDYRTLVNIHNPQSWNVTITKKVVIASEEEPRNPIKPVYGRPYILQPDYAFRMDCNDIYTILGTSIVPGTFIEGFVVLFPSSLSRPIDVTALYTASPAFGAGVSTMHTEVIKPKVSIPTTTAYID
jgi:hypothetical protein